MNSSASLPFALHLSELGLFVKLFPVSCLLFGTSREEVWFNKETSWIVLAWIDVQSWGRGEEDKILMNSHYWWFSTVLELYDTDILNNVLIRGEEQARAYATLSWN